MLKKLWIFQPDEIVPLGRYEKAITAINIPYQLLELWHNPPLPELNPQNEALIILGGRPSALDTETLPWLQELYQKLPAWVADGLPVLGICLGHQIIAQALGGKVSLQDMQGGEEGPCQISLTTAALTDPIFTPHAPVPAGIEPAAILGNLATTAKKTPQQAIVYQSHHDIVVDLPPKAILLASSKNCKNQAFRYQNSWSVQFHPETTAEIMQTWAKGEGTDGQAMYQSCQKVDKEVGKFGLQILENFLNYAQQR